MSIVDIQITEVLLKDLPVLQEISRRTFFDSFAEGNSEENMQAFLDRHFSYEKLKLEIENTNSTFFFAISGSRILGYLKVNGGSAQTVLPNNGGFEIERIYIDKDFKGLGVGQQFLRKAESLAKAAGANHIWLGVWEENKPAIRFYEKNGFAVYNKHIFLLGDDPQTDLLLKKSV